MTERKRFKDFLESPANQSIEERLKDLMEDDDYQDLVDAIHNPKIGSTTIVKALTAMGFEVSRAAVSRWKSNVKVR